ncbi:MAG: ribonuclease H-like domain-containing protein [Thermovirgaceae bacterium]
MTDGTERFQRLERLLGPVQPERVSRKLHRISGLPEGEWLDDGVFLMEGKFPLSGRHGTVPLGDVSKAEEILQEWGATSSPVFLDLETTGLAGGTGTYAFLAGTGRIINSSFVIRQIFLSTPEAENTWLDHLFEWIAPATGFVTYNGKRFDLPILQSRSILNKKPPPDAEKGHLDLLYLARWIWKGRLPDCRLGTIENGVLGVKRDHSDVPGWLVPRHYADFLRTGNAGPLSGVFIHNMTDILSLASLEARIASLLSGSTTKTEDLLRAGDLWASRGKLHQAEQLWSMAEKDASTKATQACLRLAFTAKRHQRWEQAAELFERSLVDRSSRITALVELSKIFEHKFRLYGRAIEYAEKAMESHREIRPYMEARDWSRKSKELRHRLKRLCRKEGVPTSALRGQDRESS